MIINRKTKSFLLFSHLIFIYIFILIVFSCKNTGEKSFPSTPVFSNEIAPIIYKNCTPCHRPGSGAPFNLISHEDIKKHLHTVQVSINERLMPPWPADTSYTHFRDEKVLTKDEILLLNKWIDNGAPIGDISKIPPLPEFYNQSRFGKPDLIIKMREAYIIKGDNKDNFIMLKIPYELLKDTFLRGIEIVPGNKKLVHHINAHLIQYETGAKKNIYSGTPFVNIEISDKKHAFEILDVINDDGSYPLLTPSVTNYLPGVEASFYPDGIGGFRIKKTGAILLDNIHYGPSPIDTTDLTSFNLFFSPHPPLRPVNEFILGTSGISIIEPPLIIPADSIKKFTTTYRVPEDMSLLTINPHMHLLGVSFLAYAFMPDGDTIPLIRIPKWDFRWQYFYTFQKIIKIPAGSFIKVEGVYDNTVNNPLNPFHPPQVISEREGSMRTTDEMFQLICTYIPYKSGDENIILNSKINSDDR